jgi:hypothetical protein
VNNDKVNGDLFYTNKGKKVYELNGIKPDIIVAEDSVKSELAKMLIENFITYNFITYYRDTISKNNTNILDDVHIYNTFVNYATDYNNAKHIKTISELSSIKMIDTNKKIVNIIDNAIDSMLSEYKNILLKDGDTKYAIKRFLDYDYKMRTLNDNDFIKHILTDDKNLKIALQLF